MRRSFSRGWSRYYKSDTESEQNTVAEIPDKEGNVANVRDFVALLPRTTSLSLNSNKEDAKKQSLRLIQSEGSLKSTGNSELPDVVVGDAGIAYIEFLWSI